MTLQLLDNNIRAHNRETHRRRRRVASWNDIAAAQEQVLRAVDSQLAVYNRVLDVGALTFDTTNFFSEFVLKMSSLQITLSYVWASTVSFVDR